MASQVNQNILLHYHELYSHSFEIDSSNYGLKIVSDHQLFSSMGTESDFNIIFTDRLGIAINSEKHHNLKNKNQLDQVQCNLIRYMIG
jgi:hypothetical protein